MAEGAEIERKFLLNKDTFKELIPGVSSQELDLEIIKYLEKKSKENEEKNPEEREVSKRDIVQGYIPAKEKQKVLKDGTVVTDIEERIRQTTEDGVTKYFYTMKGKLEGTKEEDEGLKRYEKEEEITEEHYNGYLKNIDEKELIYKTRYVIKLPNGHKAELDTFRNSEFNNYEGTKGQLMTVEVEFNSLEESEEFEQSKPNWFGEEETKNSKFKNKNLAKFLENSKNKITGVRDILTNNGDKVM